MTKTVRAAVMTAAALLIGIMTSGVQAATSIDPNHTQTHFTAKHLLISTVEGFVPVTSVEVTLGSDNVPTAVEAVMDLSKINTNNDQRDRDLRSDRFLDVEKYPEMTFKSTSITPGANNTFVMNGDLTIHGVTKPVVVNCTIGGTVKDNQGRTHIGYAASTTIDRTQFGVGTGVPSAVVGNTIAITIEAEAIRT